MKYLIPILLILCLILLLGRTNDQGKDITELREGYRLLSKKIEALEGQIGLCAEEKKALIAEIREITKPLTRLVPVGGLWIGIKEEMNE